MYACICRYTEADCGRERRRRIYLRRGKVGSTELATKVSPLGAGFWIYLEFRCGFVDGLNSPRANSRQMIERLPKRRDKGYVSNLFKNKQIYRKVNLFLGKERNITNRDESRAVSFTNPFEEKHSTRKKEFN